MWHRQNKYKVLSDAAKLLSYSSDMSDKYTLETLNVGSDGDDVIESCRLFHVRVAATGKARSPTVNRRVVGTTRAQVDATLSVDAAVHEVGDTLEIVGKVLWRQTVKTVQRAYTRFAAPLSVSANAAA